MRESVLSLIGAVALAACSGTAETPAPAPAPTEPAPAEAPAKVEAKHAALFGVLPDSMYASEPATEAQVALGRMLYYETRISKNHDLSCNSCHKLDAYGVDNEPTSPGHKGVRGARNSPTTYNAALHLAQFWDGRAADVEEQAKGPVLNPVEMAMPDADYVIRVLKSIPGYQEAFSQAFPGEADPITYDNFGKAVGAFERGLVTKDCDWDRYASGQADAMTPEELAGLDLFVETGCPACHMGALFGGGMYQKIGAVNPYETKDVGRFEVTKADADKYFFKVPSLRNVAKTAPYFHDGSVATLDDAVRKMAHYQLGKELTDEQVASIVTFLGSLTGQLPTEYVAVPTMPESGPDTPKADPS